MSGAASGGVSVGHHPATSSTSSANANPNTSSNDVVLSLPDSDQVENRSNPINSNSTKKI